MIPKLSNPLKASIRTGEGILVYAVSVITAVGSLIEPSKLPPKEAAIVVGALAAVHTFARSGLKAIATINKTFDIGSPEVPAGLPAVKMPAGEEEQVV
jgi:hypothetical protein